jgi:AraC-like DNA-binding protein
MAPSNQRDKNYEEKYLKYRDRVVFGKQSMPTFDRIPKEYKENEACFIFVNKGEFSVRSQIDYMDLNKGHGLLAKCLNYFFEKKIKPEEPIDEIEVIAVLLYPSIVKELFEFDVFNSDYTFDFNLKQIEIDRLLENFKDSINILLDNPELADDKIVETKLREFILLVSKSQEAPSQLDFLAALFKPNHTEFKSTIQQNLYSDLSLDELAALCHLSMSSFKRKFNDVFKDSPKKYIIKKKIERAAELLKSEDLRVSDIAFDVGFDSLSTFNRNFTNLYGKSPTEYRLS